MGKREERIINRLHMQEVFLETVIEGHIFWANDTEDPAIKNEHLEIAELLRHTARQYLRLIEDYQDVAPLPYDHAFP